MKRSMLSKFAGVLNTTVEYLVCGEIRFRGIDEGSAEVLDLLSSMDENTRELFLI